MNAETKKTAKSLFIPYELAVKAKEKGFNEPCMKGVKDNEEFTTCGFNLTNNGTTHDFTLPLYQQAVDWLREEHGWKISESEECHPCVVFNIKKLKADPNGSKFVMADTYYESLNKAIEETFKMIKDISESKVSDEN